MHLRKRLLVTLCLVAGSLALERPADAQPVRDHRTQKPAPTTTPPAPAPAPEARDRKNGRDRRDDDRDRRGPRSAPPAPRAETPGTRAGYVFIAGQWDWKNDNWEWVPGHWEREKAGKRWNASRWEQRGDRWEHVAGGWIDATPTTPAPNDGRPRTAPPAPRTESVTARAGYVWIPGRWDWRANTWEWVAGHWEREKAGKRWREARWEQRDGAYVLVNGEWIDVSAGPNVPPPSNRPTPARRWTIERPVVSSYWPVKGDAGARVVVRGKNFPTDATIVFAGQPVRGAKITPTQIQFVVPTGAATGEITLRAGSGRKRDLSIGSFEIAPKFDAEAERRRIEEEERKKAEAAWAARQKQLAKDRAAREAELRRMQEERAATRDARRATIETRLRERWERAFLADADTQDELALHAQRSAELARMQQLAEIVGDGKLVVRISVLRSREDARHDQRMTALQASFRAGGTR